MSTETRIFNASILLLISLFLSVNLCHPLNAASVSNDRTQQAAADHGIDGGADPTKALGTNPGDKASFAEPNSPMSR